MRTEYDALHRPIAEWISGTGVLEYRHSCTVYGDQHLQAAARNLYGAVCLTLDQGGSDRLQQADFKGNPLQVERQLCTAYTTHTDWSALDLTADADAIFAAAQLQLDAEVFSATTSYDAHGQVISTTQPDGSITTPIYAIDGQIERFSVQMPGQAAVEVLQEQLYSAKGQRESVLYGNGVRTTYTFDDLTRRLTALQTHRQADAAGSNDLQALSYTYDADGRIVEIVDAAQQTQYFNNSVVSADQRFEYDALGRLTKATGRERAGGVNNSGGGYQPHTAFNTVPHANDANQVRRYTQTYQYDTLGNITQLKHSYNSGGVTGGWTRNYNYAYPGDPTNRTNRLLNTEVSGAFQNLTYDARGNTATMAHLPQMDWDLLDQLQHVQLPGGGDAWYVYDSSGMRTRAVTVTTQGLIKERIYLGGLEIYRERQGAGPVRLERETLRISDAAGSFLQVDTKRIDTGGHDPDNALGVPLFRYSHGNHLGSATLTTDDAGQAVAYEEMRPYGTVAWRAGAPRELSLKRYRFTGKERDVETGLDYFGARYYAPWLGRWLSCDPAGFVDGLNLYRYCRNDPVGHVDPDGRQVIPTDIALKAIVYRKKYGEGDSGMDNLRDKLFDSKIDKNFSLSTLLSAILDPKVQEIVDLHDVYPSWRENPSIGHLVGRLNLIEDAVQERKREGLPPGKSFVLVGLKSEDVALPSSRGFSPTTRRGAPLPERQNLSNRDIRALAIEGDEPDVGEVSRRLLAVTSADGAVSMIMGVAGGAVFAKAPSFGGSARKARSLLYGVENIDSFKSLNAARTAARKSSGLGDDAVDFIQEIGPMKGRITGRMSPDGSRGWRLDWDPEKEFHVNWWNKSGGKKRPDWLYGANKVEGGTL